MTDQDIERWTAEWRAGSPPVADLARLARRESQVRSAHGSRSTGSVGAGLLAFAAWIWFDRYGSTVMRFAAVGIAVLTVVALAFSVINWRGSFAGDRGPPPISSRWPSRAAARGCATSASVAGCWSPMSSSLRAPAAVEFRDEGFGRLPGMLVSATLATLAVAVVLFAWRRRERRRAERLAAMQRAMQPETESPDE